MTILRDISLVYTSLFSLIVLLTLFESRFPSKKFLRLTLFTMVPLLVVNCVLLFVLGPQKMSTLLLLTCSLPSLVFFWFVAKHRDGRFFFTFCLADTLVLDPADVEAYYDTNEAIIQANYGIEKIDKNVVNVRHILIQPAAAEDGTISDDAWAAAETQANEIYEQWKAGVADEAFFAELATANTQDPGSQATGGLYEEVYPGQMVPEFNDWCFADDRQVGDHGVVKTSYGYHIMFFSGEGDYVYWRMAAEDMLRMERAAEERATLVESYTLESDLTKAILLDATAPTAPAAEAPAEGETAE